MKYTIGFIAVACIAQQSYGVNLRPKSSQLNFKGFTKIDKHGKETGTLHRCTFKGHPDALHKFLTYEQKNNPEDFYYGRSKLAVMSM